MRSLSLEVWIDTYSRKLVHVYLLYVCVPSLCVLRDKKVSTDKIIEFRGKGWYT